MKSRVSFFLVAAIKNCSQHVSARLYLGGTTSGRKRRSSAATSTTQGGQTSSRGGGRGVKRANVSSACAARASFTGVVRHCALFWFVWEIDDCSWPRLCFFFLLGSLLLNDQGMSLCKREMGWKWLMK